MKVTARAEVWITAPIDEVFDTVTAPDAVGKTFTGYGPIPAVRSSKLATEGGMRKGAIRRIYSEDGSVIDEEIIALVRPHTQTYRLIAGIRPPFSWLIRGAEGHWTLRSEGAKTHIAWVFTFSPHNAVTGAVVRLVLRPAFRRAMDRCLTNTKALIEA